MAIAAKAKRMVEIGRGKPPFPIQKLAALPKDELPAVQQPASRQPEKPKFFTTPVLVGGAILLGLGALTFANRNAVDKITHDARVKDLMEQPQYAGASSTRLESLATLCKKYGITTDDMAQITKISEKLNMPVEKVLEIIQKYSERLKSGTVITGESKEEGEVLTAFNQSSRFRDGFLSKFRPFSE